MFTGFARLSMLAAEAVPTSPGAKAGPRTLFQQFINGPIPFILIICVFMYFFIFAPQRKKEKRRRQMLDAVEKGAKVVSIGGIHGTILQVGSDEVVLDLGNDQKVTLSRGAIARVVTDEGQENR